MRMVNRLSRNLPRNKNNKSMKFRRRCEKRLMQLLVLQCELKNYYQIQISMNQPSWRVRSVWGSWIVSTRVPALSRIDLMMDVWKEFRTLKSECRYGGCKEKNGRCMIVRFAWVWKSTCRVSGHVLTEVNIPMGPVVTDMKSQSMIMVGNLWSKNHRAR